MIRFRLCIAAAVLVVSALALPARGEFVWVGTHPDAAAQPTLVGQRLMTLKTFNGQIFAGYGDWGANTGPIPIRGFNPVSNTWTEDLLSSRTEAIYLYREIHGRLYAPHTDPKGTSIGGYAMGVADGLNTVFTDHRPVSGLHMFDMATYDGTDLWLVGSAGSNATAWRSTDGGETWTVELSVAPENPDTFARFYGVGVYNNKLYVQANDYSGGPHSHSMAYDGTGWSAGPNLLPNGGQMMWQPEVFAGKMIYLRSYYTLNMYVFDGQRNKVDYLTIGKGQNAYQPWFRDYLIEDGILYALREDRMVMSTRDLDNWTLLTQAPANSQSLTVVGNRLYVGTMDSELFRFETPLFLSGDANRDGNVDVDDLGILASNYRLSSGATWSMGDFNGDGRVDVSDLGILATHYRSTGAVLVPEPGGLGLLLAAAMFGVMRRRRRR